MLSIYDLQDLISISFFGGDMNIAGMVMYVVVLMAVFALTRKTTQTLVLSIPVTLVEQKDTCGGLVRNRRCLAEYPIRLICGQTITEVKGYPALTGCRLSGGEYLPCKQLLIAAGLRPDRALIAALGNPPWLHLCGNCNVVHPMVEGVTAEGTRAGIAAALTLRRTKTAEETACKQR